MMESESISFLIRIKKKGDNWGVWQEKELSEFDLLQLIRILFKERRNKELGFFWYDYYKAVLSDSERRKSKIAELGLKEQQFEKYKKLQDEKEIGRAHV